MFVKLFVAYCNSSTSELGSNEDERLQALFDASWYRSQLTSNIESGKEFDDYLKNGRYIYNPNPLFDTHWYLERYPELEETGVNPLQHYLDFAEPRGEGPCSTFSPKDYMDANPDVKAAGVSPLTHYLQFGIKEGRRLAVFKIERTRDIEWILQALRPTALPTHYSIKHQVSDLEQFAKRYPDKCDLLYRSTVNGISRIEPFDYPSTPRVYTLRDAYAMGGSRYLISNDIFINDESFHFISESSIPEKVPDAIKSAEDRTITLKAGFCQGAWVDTGIHLMHEADTNYFHFISEVAPRMALINEAKIDKDIPLIVSANLHANIFEMIERLNVDHRPIYRLQRGVLYRIRKMYYPTDCSVIPDAYEGGKLSRISGLDTSRIKMGIQKIRSSRTRISSSYRHKRIFATRESQYRVLENQKAIADRLMELGFRIINTSEMDLDEQISAFESADLIVGATGAQMTNMIWCKEGANIVILSSDHPNHQLYLWTLLARLSEANVSFVHGSRSYRVKGIHGIHDDFTVDTESLIDSLSHII